MTTYFDSADREHFVKKYCVTESGKPLKNGYLIFELLLAGGELIHVPGTKRKCQHYKMRKVSEFRSYQRMADTERERIAQTYSLGAHAEMIIDELVKGDRLVAYDDDGHMLVLKLRSDTTPRKDGDYVY